MKHKMKLALGVLPVILIVSLLGVGVQPAELADESPLVIRLTQPKKGISVERVFNNITFYSK